MAVLKFPVAIPWMFFSFTQSRSSTGAPFSAAPKRRNPDGGRGWVFLLPDGGSDACHGDVTWTTEVLPVDEGEDFCDPL